MTEPLLLSIASIENALNRAGQLPRTDYDSALLAFRHHAHEAIHALREWAKANGVDA